MVAEIKNKTAIDAVKNPTSSGWIKVNTLENNLKKIANKFGSKSKHLREVMLLEMLTF